MAPDAGAPTAAPPIAATGAVAACFALAACLALAACAGTLQRDYAGRIAPAPEFAATCPGAPATLVTRGGRFSFTPTDGAILLAGDIAPDGGLAARLVTPGVDRKPFVMDFAGRLDGARVTGTYTTPRCRFTVALTER